MREIADAEIEAALLRRLARGSVHYWLGAAEKLRDAAECSIDAGVLAAHQQHVDLACQCAAAALVAVGGSLEIDGVIYEGETHGPGSGAVRVREMRAHANDT